MQSWLKNLEAPNLHPAVLWGVLILLLLGTLPLLLLLGYNLAAPLFHAPLMTYGEAFGIMLLAEMLVGVVVLLKE